MGARNSRVSSQKTKARKRFCLAIPSPTARMPTNVQQEFSSLADDANVYRLVGPVLLKQDSSEAKGTVDSRLGYIEQEMYANLTLPSINHV